MKRRSGVRTLYSALFDLSLLREQVAGLAAEQPHLETARLLARAVELEAKALQLIDRVETTHRIAAH
jgi:hypothetical protein